MSLRGTYQKDKGVAPSGGGAARTRPVRPAGGGGASSSGGFTASEKQIDAVRAMQRIMGRLEEMLAMADVAQKAATLLNNQNVTADVIMKDSRSWGATSAGGTSGSYDGLWGGNTKGSLEKIAAFVKNAGIDGVIIQPGTGDKPYNDMKDEDVIKIANDNITNLGRLFTKLGLSVPTEVGQRAGSGYVLDKVSQSLDNTMIGASPWPEYYGDYPITVGDLRDFLTFFYMIQGLGYTDCEPLSTGSEKKEVNREEEEARYQYASLPESKIEKLAREVLEKSIFRLAQEAPAAQPATPEEVKPAEEASDIGEDGVCVNVIDDIIRWFARRSRSIYAQMIRGSERSEPHPLYTNRVISPTDTKAAQGYMSAIRNIYTQWMSIKKNIEKKLIDEGKAQRPVVTQDILLDVLRGGLDEPGGGAARRREQGGVGSGGAYTVPAGTYSQAKMEGPIANYMPLESLNVSDGFTAEQQTIQDLTGMTKGGELPSIDMREWRGGNWADIAIQYIKAPTQTEQLRKFPEWASNVQRIVNEMFRYWQDDIHQMELPRNARDRVMRAQQTILGRWNAYIRAAIADSQRNMANAVARVNSGQPMGGRYR